MTKEQKELEAQLAELEAKADKALSSMKKQDYPWRDTQVKLLTEAKDLIRTVKQEYWIYNHKQER